MEYVMENWSKIKHTIAVLAHIVIIFLCLTFTPLSKADTYIIPVQDLLIEIPNFDNKPDFSINSAIRGENPIGDLKKDSPRSKKAQENALLEIIREMYPDCDVRIWRGNLIITER